MHCCFEPNPERTKALQQVCRNSGCGKCCERCCCEQEEKRKDDGAFVAVTHIDSGPQDAQRPVAVQNVSRKLIPLRELSIHEQMMEKERLHDLVKAFSIAGVSGQKCSWIQTKPSISIQAASYSLDSNLKAIRVTLNTLQSSESGSSFAEYVEMSSILKVFRGVTRTQSFQMAPGLAPGWGLDAESFCERFVCLQCYPQGAETASQSKFNGDVNMKMREIGLLLTSPDEAQTFCVCMKILRWAIAGSPIQASQQLEQPEEPIVQNIMSTAV